LAEPLKQKVLQRHHVDGRDASDFVVWLCLWCHGPESDAQYDLDPRLRHPRTREEQLLARLAGDARLFRRWGEVFQSRSDWLEQRIGEALRRLEQEDSK